MAVLGMCLTQGSCAKRRELTLGSARRDGLCASQASPEQPPKTDHKQAVNMEQQSLGRPR